MYYANQKQITIRREQVQGSKKSSRPYLIAFQDNIEGAMKELTPATFKVYVYLLCNRHNYAIEFSPEHISNVAGICKDTARRALTQLEECGYVKKIDDHKYIFRECKYISYEDTNRSDFYG